MRALLCILLLLAPVACEQESGTSSQRVQQTRIDPDDPCALLAPDEVEEAIGTPVRSEREVDSHDLVTRICLYKTTKPFASVGVIVSLPMSRDEFVERLQRDPINTEELEGVADMSYIHGCASVEVWQDDVSASAAVQHLTTCEEMEAVLGRLAETLVAKLESSLPQGR